MLQPILNQFPLNGTPVSCERYGSGHINETYLVVTDAGKRYILQKINHHVFQDVEGLMRNISAVTEHLSRKDADPRHSLHIIPTNDGKAYATENADAYWRVYDFVEGSLCLQAPETLEDFRQSALAFGSFQRALADFPAGTLAETIPQFHDTPNRYRNLHAAMAADGLGRAASVQPEIAFALAHEADADRNMALLRAGKLPLRVTHNDTKLNNVLLDAETRTPLCVIDLDTVMPGLVANDFGDSIRFGASTGAEDEKDLGKIEMSLERFAAYTEGFLEACGASLTQEELESLPWGAKLMTLEVGIRFLTDYLEGDIYFHTAYPEHNLDRMRTQFKLVADMEAKWTEMQKIIRNVSVDI